MQVSCNGKVSCEFNVKITKQMIPQSTVMVYSVKNKQSIYQGKTIIETEDLSENYVCVQHFYYFTQTNSKISYLVTVKAFKYRNRTT